MTQVTRCIFNLPCAHNRKFPVDILRHFLTRNFKRKKKKKNKLKKPKYVCFFFKKVADLVFLLPRHIQKFFRTWSLFNNVAAIYEKKKKKKF